MTDAKLSAGTEKTLRAETGFKRYLASLKYALYVITHPFDGFWDLNRENRGSMAAAHTLLALFLLTYVLKLMYTNFQFIIDTGIIMLVMVAISAFAKARTP